MKPESFRQLRIEPGTLIGLVGDYDVPSRWSNNTQVRGVLSRYLVVERHHTPWKKKGERVWDAAAIVLLTIPLKTISIESEECLVNELLLIQRYPDSPWENGCCVHVFGVREGKTLGHGPLPTTAWPTKTIHLSLAADLTVLPTA